MGKLTRIIEKHADGLWRDLNGVVVNVTGMDTAAIGTRIEEGADGIYRDLKGVAAKVGPASVKPKTKLIVAGVAVLVIILALLAAFAGDGVW